MCQINLILRSRTETSGHLNVERRSTLASCAWQVKRNTRRVLSRAALSCQEMAEARTIWPALHIYSWEGFLLHYLLEDEAWVILSCVWCQKTIDRPVQYILYSTGSERISQRDLLFSPHPRRLPPVTDNWQNSNNVHRNADCWVLKPRTHTKKGYWINRLLFQCSPCKSLLRQIFMKQKAISSLQLLKAVYSQSEHSMIRIGGDYYICPLYNFGPL